MNLEKFFSRLRKIDDDELFFIEICELRAEIIEHFKQKLRQKFREEEEFRIIFNKCSRVVIEDDFLYSNNVLFDFRNLLRIDINKEDVYLYDEGFNTSIFSHYVDIEDKYIDNANERLREVIQSLKIKYFESKREEIGEGKIKYYVRLNDECETFIVDSDDYDTEKI